MSAQCEVIGKQAAVLILETMQILYQSVTPRRIVTKHILCSHARRLRKRRYIRPTISSTSALFPGHFRNPLLPQKPGTKDDPFVPAGCVAQRARDE